MNKSLQETMQDVFVCTKVYKKYNFVFIWKNGMSSFLSLPNLLLRGDFSKNFQKKALIYSYCCTDSIYKGFTLFVCSVSKKDLVVLC